VTVEGRDVAVAEQLLDRADVATRLQQVRGECVPQRVRRGGLGDAGGADRVLDGALDRLFVQVVAPPYACTWVARGLRGGEHPEPAPGLARRRVLDRERARKLDPRRHARSVVLPGDAGLGQLAAQRFGQCPRHHRHAVPAALAMPHGDLAARAVDVLYAQVRALHQPHSGPVEKCCH
jgi:hypothetical protein